MQPSPPSHRPDATGATRPVVVVIDDSPTALGAVAKWLEEESYDVVPLSRSLGATRVIMRVRPNVLLLDIRLPGLSGDRLAKVLSQSPATASVPIIFYSQIDPGELKRLAHECSVVGAISKTNDRMAFVHEFTKLAGPFLKESPEGGLSAHPPELGVPEIDRQHRRVKQLLTRMLTLMRDRPEGDIRATGRRELKDVALELLVFMKFHLATEDRYMRESNHPRIEEHRAEHSHYLDEAQKVEKQLEGDMPTAELVDSARALRLLILEHMWSSDPDLDLGPISSPLSTRRG